MKRSFTARIAVLLLLLAFAAGAYLYFGPGLVKPQSTAENLPAKPPAAAEPKASSTAVPQVARAPSPPPAAAPAQPAPGASAAAPPAAGIAPLPAPATPAPDTPAASAPSATAIQAAPTQAAPVPPATQAPQQPAARAPRAKPDDSAPSFDVARIEPSGDAVIAGRAAPGSQVELLRGGEVHDRAVADPSGNFVIVAKPLPSGSYDLTLRATGPEGKVSTSKDSVAVALNAGASEKPVVALVAPDKPAVVLSKPAADAPPGVLAIDAVESESAGRLYVSGRSPPGSSVRLYLNDAFIAAATASPEGRVTFVIQSGVRPGDYRVRLDQVDAGGKVQKRAEVPFNAPAALAATPRAAPSGKPSAASDATPKPPAAASLATASPPPPAAAVPPPASSPASAAAAAPPLQTVQAASPPGASVSRLAAAPPAVRPEALPAPAASPPIRSTDTPAEPPAPPAKSETAVAGTPASSEPASPAAAEDRRHVVMVPSIDTTVVVRGDSLWRISQATYGQGIRYTVIYSANRKQIRDPDLIYPGQIFVLPKAAPAP